MSAPARAGAGRPAMPDFAAQVLDVVDGIPPGQVLSYGDVAEAVGRGGPRQVGRVMALWGGGVPWWRVIRADGRPAPGHERESLDRYLEEGTPLRASGMGGGFRVDMARARWPGPGADARPEVAVRRGRRGV